MSKIHKIVFVLFEELQKIGLQSKFDKNAI